MLVYLYEEFVIIECPECGEEFIMEWDEFEEMLEEEGLELEIFEDDEDECEYCDCDDCEGCYEYDEDEEESADEELDEELIELLDEMRFCREEGDYEGYAILAEAYATLFELIYE
jgi:hypothetical protein